MKNDGAQGDRSILLRNARLFDPESGFDQAGEVLIEGGLITEIGANLLPGPGIEEIDLHGAFLTAGWVDLHVHAFGGLGFSNADAIGVYQGVTAICDAGGTGAYTYDDFAAQLDGRLATDLYSWLFVGPWGIASSIVFEEQLKDIRAIIPDLPITQMLDLVDQHRATIAGMKVPAWGPTGEVGPMRMAKGLAETLGLPLYVHVGDIQEEQPLPLDLDAVIDLLTEGDMITHCYTPTPNSLFDKDHVLLSSVQRAVERGVAIDLGMGAFNFDFEIARHALDIGFVPTTLSTDLQQANVTGPTHSLTNVASMFLALGMTIEEIVPRVTSRPAAHLGIAERHGTLAVGRPANLTAFQIRHRDVTFHDTVGGRLPGDRVIEVELTIKDGVAYQPDPSLAIDLRNWSMQSAVLTDRLPDSVGSLSREYSELFVRLAVVLEQLEVWSPREVQRVVRQLQVHHVDLPLGDSGRAILGAFMDPVFPQSPGLFLGMQDRGFVVDRLRRAGADVESSAHPSRSSSK